MSNKLATFFIAVASDLEAVEFPNKPYFKYKKIKFEWWETNWVPAVNKLGTHILQLRLSGTVNGTKCSSHFNQEKFQIPLVYPRKSIVFDLESDDIFPPRIGIEITGSDDEMGNRLSQITALPLNFYFVFKISLYG